MSTKWQECFSKTHNRMYYFNNATKETVWEKPADFVAEGQQALNGSASKVSHDDATQPSAKRSRAEVTDSDNGHKRENGASRVENHSAHHASHNPAAVADQAFVRIAESLFAIWKQSLATGMADADATVAPFEIEARVGMIVQNEARWRQQVVGSEVIPIYRDGPNVTSTEFRAGVDESFIVDAKKILAEKGFHADVQVDSATIRR
jgi:hypothetical protein